MARHKRTKSRLHTKFKCGKRHHTKKTCKLGFRKNSCKCLKRRKGRGKC